MPIQVWEIREIGSVHKTVSVGMSAVPRQGWRSRVIVAAAGITWSGL